MDYKDAIEYLRANNIKKDDDSFYEFGDVCWAIFGLSKSKNCSVYTSCKFNGLMIYWIISSFCCGIVH